MRTSIVIPICRTEYLENQLSYITTMRGFDDSVEVIYVENPQKTQTVADIISRFGANNVQHLESEAGANRARNRGIEAATGDIIILLDDDVYPEQYLLQAYLGAYTLYPGVGVYGGKVLHTFYTKRPKWFTGYFKHLVGWLDRGNDIHDVTNINYELDAGLISANLSFRKSTWAKAGKFVETIGQQAGGHAPELSNADEILFINKCGATAKNEAVRKLYVGRAIGWHQISPERMTLPYLLKKSYGHGCGCAESLVMSASKEDYYVEDLISEFLMPAYNATLNFHDLMNVRNEICHEESTRLYMKYALLCKGEYVRGFIETLDRSRLPSYEQHANEPNALFLTGERYKNVD